MSSFESKSVSVEQYLRRLSGQEKEPEIIFVDHNYAKLWNAHPDSNRTRPAKMLFMKQYPKASSDGDLDEEVDIVSCDDPLPSPFESTKSKLLMNECERFQKYHPAVDEVDKEDQLLTMTAEGKLVLRRTNWSDGQRRLFLDVMNLLERGKLAKLAYAGTSNEPVKRRIAMDKSAKQLRHLFATFSWDMKLLTWLHTTLLECCNASTLAVYLDVLQSLKAKVPHLVDRHPELMNQLLKRPWDPVQPLLAQYKPRKLPGNPVVIVTPSGYMPAAGPRLRFWNHQLSTLCKVLHVPLSLENSCTDNDSLSHIMDTVKNKVAEVRNHYPSRPIVLLGWTIGALIACHIALEEPVAAVICLGFPLTGVNGSRGDLEDPLLDSKVPTLFMVGQNASLCSTDDMEDFRSRMRAETGLVVVGGADDLLRLSQLKMTTECLTQAMVDRCLIDEMSDFLLLVLNVPPKAKDCMEEEAKRRRRKPREYSPEPAKKRARMATPRQAASATTKSRLSPSSSETSSSGSFFHEKPGAKAVVKKPSEKRVGRPAAGTWRKRHASKNFEGNEKEATSAVPKDRMPPLKSLLENKMPFMDILAKKNDPVDVEKAFGRDSSFLPRPLTPTEPEDTISAEETENVMSQLEAMANSSTTIIKSESESPVKTGLISKTVVVDTRTISSSTVVTTKVVSNVCVERPIVVSKIDSEPKSPAASLRTVFPQAKILTSLQTLRNTSSPKSFVFSMNPQQNKMIQLHKMKPGKTTESSESCNLSLLSDVAGMTERIKEVPKKLEAVPPATLVKLSSMDPRLKFVKSTVRPATPPVRMETPEELAEKQMAIQALRNMDKPSTSGREPGYSICYAKPDGSIVSRSLARPGYPLYMPPGKARGRGRTVLQSKEAFRYYDMM